MRVITGISRGKPLETPYGQDVRPTTSKVKESIFSAIQFDIANANVLDLFCGSGQLGIEALSRGAKGCTFVDSAKYSISATKQNLINTALLEKTRIVHSDYKSFLQMNNDTFDIIFLDPPYNKGILVEVMPLISNILNDGGIIICEHSNEDVPLCEGILLKKEYKFSKIKVTMLIKPLINEGV